MKLNDAPDNDVRPNFIKLASPKYQQMWESFTSQQKQLIESQASLRTLDTTAKVDRFLESREFVGTSSLRISAENSNRFFKQVHSQQNTSRLNESQVDNDPVIRSMKRLQS